MTDATSWMSGPSTEDNDDVVQIIANGRDAGYATSRGIRVPVGEVLRINSVADLNAAFGEGSEIANAFRLARERTSPALATGDDLDRLAVVYDMIRGPAEPDEVMRERIFDSLRTTVRGTVRQYVNGEWRELRPMTATQQREADARAAWRERVLSAIGAGEFRRRSCASCGRWSFPYVLCSECSGVESPWNRLHATPSALSRWRERLAAWQRHVAPLPLGVLGGVCASRLYPEAPRAHDAVRLRCPLRRSPDRGVTLCVAQPTTDCVTPTRREA